MKNSKVSFITIFMLGLALVLVLYYYLLYGRLDDKIKALDKERVGYETEYAMLVENMDKTDKLEQEVSDKTKRVAELTGAMANENALNIADEVYKAMRKVGLNETSVTSVSVGDTENTGNLTTDNKSICRASINLYVNCSFDIMQKFLQEFENSNKAAFYVPNLTMTQADDGQHYNVSITYYYAEKSNAPLTDEQKEQIEKANEDGFDKLLEDDNGDTK